MAITKVLARDWKLEINAGDEASPDWIEVKGITSFTFGGSKSDADTTSFDDNGVQSHIVTSRQRTVSIEGYFLEDETGARDPGQQAVEDLAQQIGPASIGHFRLTSPGGKQYEFRASAVVSEVGGGVEDPTSWNVELTVSGHVTIA